VTSDLPGLGLREALADLLELHALTVDQTGRVQLRGRLLLPSQEAYDLAASRLRLLGYTPYFRREKQDDLIIAMPGFFPPMRERIWINGLLFFLTILSTLFVGAGMAGVDALHNVWQGIVAGAPFAGTLLLILTAHELGHYFVGRHYGMQRTLPYFIPMPNLFGTMGAVIALKTPPKNRRALLAMAVAGPLCGLAFALPLLVLGLKLSTVGPIIAQSGGVLEGNSLLYALLKFVTFGRWLPGGGLDVQLHPVAFAAWAGLFVSGLNLIPVGQLDGGHVMYCLIGKRARYLTWAIAGALALLALFVWPDWWLWAALLLLFGRSFATPLDDITPLNRRETALAVVMMVILVLVFTPIPLKFL
jgi:membrane-associated protease RseP (regulator of RpoE activity)